MSRSKNYIKKIVALEQERMKKLSDIVELSDFFFKNKLEYDEGLLKWKNMTDEEVKQVLTRLIEMFSDISEKDWTKEKLEPLLKEEARRIGDNGKVFWPLRVALSGKKNSPPPLEIAEILGKDKCLARLRKAIAIHLLSAKRQ